MTCKKRLIRGLIYAYYLLYDWVEALVPEADTEDDLEREERARRKRAQQLI